MLIDVRNHSDFISDGRIPYSINIPLHELMSGVFQLPDKHFQHRYKIDRPTYDTKVVISCYTGKLALMSSKYLRSQGYLYARAYNGSFRDWISNGGTIIKGAFRYGLIK